MIEAKFLSAVYDGDKSSQSRVLIETYRASNYFELVAYVPREADLTSLIDRGDVRGALAVRRLRQGLE